MTIKKSRLAGRDRKEANMKFQYGIWSYKGKTYNSLYEALVDIWSKR